MTPSSRLTWLLSFMAKETSALGPRRKAFAARGPRAKQSSGECMGLGEARRIRGHVRHAGIVGCDSSIRTSTAVMPGADEARTPRIASFAFILTSAIARRAP